MSKATVADERSIAFMDGPAEAEPSADVSGALRGPIG